MIKEKLIKLLEYNGVSIEVKGHLPYMCTGLEKDRTVFDRVEIGDNNITGFNGAYGVETVSQELMDEIKEAILSVLKKTSNI